jgi:hypothetical protein
MGSRLIIFFSIVGLRELCGMPSLLGLVGVRSCLAQSRSYLLAGGRAVVPGMLWCGKWSLFVLCGVFGESKTIDVSMTFRDTLRNLSTFFFLPFSPRQRAGWPRG